MTDTPTDVVWLLFNSILVGLIVLVTFGLPQARGYYAGKHGVGSPGDMPLYFLAWAGFLFGHAGTFYVGFLWGGYTQ